MTHSLSFLYAGNVFHVDFGFILGRDPKPFPPPMKLCKEMIEAMGGMNSSGYRIFVAHCFTAYNILRKNANLILNLFALMVEANVPDIRIEPDKVVHKVHFHSKLLTNANKNRETEANTLFFLFTLKIRSKRNFDWI